MIDSPEVMNIRQASEYLGVSPDTLYKYVSEERIPAFKLGNRWKFKKTILDSWMERKSTVGEGRDRKKPRSAKAAAGGQ
jgi:excisionase family DNA binding protein